MKKLSEMKFSKDALLSKFDSLAMGAVRVGGTNTSYYGPSNPSSITTYVDGMSIGSDGNTGSLYGDSWSASFKEGESGSLEIKKN